MHGSRRWRSVAASPAAQAGQAPFAASDPDIPITNHDRVYAAEQYSNTVSVTDPSTNTLLGEINLGTPAPGYFSPLYTGQVLVHGMGFSPDHQTLVVVSVGSNSATFVDTATNAVKHTTYVGRSPHEAFFTPDGKEVWVTVRGENYVSVLDGTTYEEKTRFIRVSDHQIVGHVPQASPFCPNIAASLDGSQVWFTLKDTGKVQVFDANPPFSLLQTIDTGPITNHVNFAHNANGTFAYVTIGGLDEVQVFRTDDFSQVATIPVGKLPHGVWPSGDGTRVYVGLESSDLQGLTPPGVAGQAVHLTLEPAAGVTDGVEAPTSVVLYDQGVLQMLEATGLQPLQPYVIALSPHPDGSGPIEPLADFTTNPAGAQVVAALGPIREAVQAEDNVQRRFLVILDGTGSQPGSPVQIQTT